MATAHPLLSYAAHPLPLIWPQLIRRSQGGDCADGGKFPTNRTGQQCFGLKQQLQVADQMTCQMSCCNVPSCDTWQWEPATAACWTGAASSCSASTAGWVGASREPLPPPAPAPVPGSKCNSSVLEGRCATTFNDSSWKPVSSPHDFVVEGTFSKYAQKSHGYLPLGAGWYRKTFTAPAVTPLPEGGLSVATLKFEGTMGVTDVWLNGINIGRHSSGYTPHEYTFSTNDTLVWGGENTLAIRVDCTVLDSWWYDGGGLYRDVSLTLTSPTYLPSYAVYAPSMLTSAIVNDTADALIAVSAQVNNLASVSSNIRVAVRLISMQGATLAEAPQTTISVPAGGALVAAANLTLKGASLWSPDSPTLYMVHSTPLCVPQTC